MPEHIVFLTGRLAEQRLHQILDGLEPRPFTYEVRQMGVKVASLMTPEIIAHRLGDVSHADRILVPGRCPGDLQSLSDRFGVRFERGPDDLADLPDFFGAAAVAADDGNHAAARVFAEITDAPALTVADIVAAAGRMRADGADVIDLGCLPATPFPHLEEAVAALIAGGFTVSIDSLDPEELLRGGRAGAHYLLSLTEETLWVADQVAAIPVLIPASHGDLDSLVRAVDRARAAGRKVIADPILDPVNFGFADSLVRYHALRRRLPEVEMLMGVGNLTELTDADTSGITAVLMAFAAELKVSNVLVVQVSPHCRRAVAEAAVASRLMGRAAHLGVLPQRLDAGLLCLRDRRPFANTPEQVAATAAMITDPSFRIEAAADGIHVYSRNGHWVADDPFDLYGHLGVAEDGGHAFYLGVELARAQIAWQLGKRYAQDSELAWGCAVAAKKNGRQSHQAPLATLPAKRRKERP